MAFVRGFSTKITTLPHLNMAFATSGPIEQSERMQEAFSVFLSFDDVMECAPESLRAISDIGGFDFGNGRDHFRLVMIGFSEKKRKCLLAVLCSEPQPELEPFALGIAPIAINPSVHFDVLRDAGLLVGDVPTGNDPEQWLLKLTDIQRGRRAGERGRPSSYEEPAEGTYFVGGAAVLTKLTKLGITQRVVRRWPDRLDDYIDPHGMQKKVAGDMAVQAPAESLPDGVLPFVRKPANDGAVPSKLGA